MWCFFFFFKQKTAYEMRISDWSSDVCSSDLPASLPSEAGSFLVTIAKEAIMSRYAITLRTDAATDENAVVGYDPPLRTYFILGFEIRRTSSRFSGYARALSNIRHCCCCPPRTLTLWIRLEERGGGKEGVSKYRPGGWP